MKRKFLIKLGISDFYVCYDKDSDSYFLGDLIYAKRFDPDSVKIPDEICALFDIQIETIYVIKEKKR